MLVRIGNSKDVAVGQMRVFDVAGVMVNLANADGLCTPLMTPVPTLGARSRRASWTARW